MPSDEIQPAGTPPLSYSLPLSDLAKRKATEIEIVPEAPTLAAIAQDLGIDALRKLRFTGTLTPLGKRDWRLEAHLGATVVQPCVVTLAPVTTRIEEEVMRIWRADMAEEEIAPDTEYEIPEDVSEEQLGSAIDIGTVVTEALALALPLYPRADEADLGEAVFTEPGKAAMTDEAARPFAGLAALRDKLTGESEDD